jgi:hypothetical protein
MNNFLEKKQALSFILLFVFVVFANIFADVGSTTNVISFDINGDQSSEMTLNNIGLAIGSNQSPSSNLLVQGNAIISNSLTIGSSVSGSSNLNLNGSMGFGSLTVSANIVLGDNSICFCDTSSANLVISLPYAGNVRGRQYIIKKVSTSNKVWVGGGGSSIDSINPLEFPVGDLSAVTLTSLGSFWGITESYGAVQTLGSSNLVGYWSFDAKSSSSNTIYDLSGYNHHGTAMKMASSNIGVTGKIGEALDFDGVNDYVVVENSSSLMGMNQISVSAWVYFRALDDYDVIVAQCKTDLANTERVYRLQLLSATRKFRFHVFTTNGADASLSNIAPTLNTWHHVVGVYNGAKVLMYVNGELQSTQPALTGAVLSYATPSNRLTIGHQQYEVNDTDSSDAIIDEVRIYNRALDAAEVNALFIEGSGH